MSWRPMPQIQVTSPPSSLLWPLGQNCSTATTISLTALLFTSLLQVSQLQLAFLDHILIQYTVLHPSYKLEYFRNAQWPDEWIDDTTQSIKEQFTNVYAKMDIENPTSSRATVVRHGYIPSNLVLIYFRSVFFLGFQPFQYV
jgi:hypothetical protein